MAQSLLEMRAEDGVVWTDGDVVFRNSPGVTWYTPGIRYMSLDDYDDRRMWCDDVVSYTPPQYHTAHRTGGICRLDFGTISMKTSAFAGKKESGNALFTNGDVSWADRADEATWVDKALATGDPNMWPPPREIYLKQRYTESDESGLVLMFDGIGWRSGIDPAKRLVTYELHGRRYTAQLLETDTDYDGNEVPLPRALGLIYYARAVRLPDDGSGRPCYHNMYVAGTLGTDWHIHDDGVDIDANGVDNGDGTFSLTASPVGEVTVSGTGVIETLSDLISWAVDDSRLALSYTYNAALEASPSPSLSYLANSQQLLIDFVSSVAAYFRHLYYENGYSLVGVAMGTPNGDRELTDGYDFYQKTSYEDPAAISLIRAAWQQRSAVEETIGKYVKTEDVEVTAESGYPYGSPESVTPYEYTRAAVRTSLAELLEYMLKPEARLSIPISDDLPVPGERITYKDEDNFGQDLNVEMYCRTIRYDFERDTVEIIGEAELS
jgi:hypothetical protein